MLAQIIPLLSGMNYQELKDFIDYCEFYYLPKLLPERDRQLFKKSVRKRRAGQKTGGLPYFDDPKEKASKFLLSPYTDAMLKAHELVIELSDENLELLFGKPDISKDNHDNAIAWALYFQKAPIRHMSKTKKSPEQEVYTNKGNIQVKKLKYKRVEKDANGNPIVKEVEAYYLYLRYWTVRGAGESGRAMNLYKSVYIGGETKGIPERKLGSYPYKSLVKHYQGLLETYGESQERIVKGKVQSFKVRPKGDDNPIAELERLIMACIDMSKDEPEIDHDCLKALQDELG